MDVSAAPFTKGTASALSSSSVHGITQPKHDVKYPMRQYGEGEKDMIKGRNKKTETKRADFDGYNNIKLKSLPLMRRRAVHSMKFVVLVP